MAAGSVVAAHGHGPFGADPRRGRPAVDVLAGTPLFRALSQECASAAARAGRFRSYAPGQIIFHQGDPGDHLYAVIEGLVKVVFASERGDEMVLNIMGPGEIFGELALLDGSPRSASIVVLQLTSVFVLPRGQLLELMSSNPALADGFLKLIGKLVRKLTEQAGDLAFLDLKGRLAKLLLQLSTTDDNVHGVVLDAGLTQSDLAGMIGASRPAVNRALQSFAARGLIEIQGRTIVLRDLDSLFRRSRVPAPLTGFSLQTERPDDQ
ncbi:MAG: Crp/Fnr family transcriptional regulator [Pseudonocardiaceae bacterium]